MKNDFFRIHALFTRTTNQSPCLHEILATGGVYGLDKGEEKMKLIKNIDVGNTVFFITRPAFG